MAQRRWMDAEDAFVEADRLATLSAADLTSLADAHWWSGHLADAMTVRERAVAAHLSVGDPATAARVALRLAADHDFRQEPGLAHAWVRRAERLLAALPPSDVHGWLERQHLKAALDRGEMEQALAHADRILELAEMLGDGDLAALGLQDRGRVLIAMGRVDEGLDLLDEAVVTAVGGDVAPFPTAIIYCNATVVAEDLSDYRRAHAFSEAAQRWCDRESISGFPGMCRVRRVELIRLRGAWEQAEREARQACAELVDFSVEFAGEGFYQIGEVRLRMGDLDGAEGAFAEAHRLGRDPLPGLARLRMLQGRPDAAAGLMERALADSTLTPLARARLLPTEVDCALAVRDLGRAQAASAALATAAEAFRTDVIQAEAEIARGRVALIEGDSDQAIEHLRRAARSWARTETPYETAQARTYLAEAYLSAGEEDAARLELDSAISAFASLGAVRDLARATALRDGTEQVPRGRGQTRSEQATFMFTDIVGSTSLIEAVGDDAWGRLLAWHDATIRALLRDHAGHEVHHAGDGFFVAFAAADPAIACARAIRRTFRDHRDRNGFAPSVRIGLHTGSALRTATGFEGAEVHAAARIGALAGGEEILASRAVVEAATADVPHGAWRSERLRGFSEPIEVAAIE
jgi:class 3 adenylate cyclase